MPAAADRSAIRPLGQPGVRRPAVLPEPWAIVALVLAALAAHGRALPHPFLIDDHFVIENDRRVHALGLPAIFTTEYWPGDAPGVGNRVWRPFTLLTLALNWQISHQPWAFRVVNLLLHVLAGWAVYRLGLLVLKNGPGALLAALLFIVHPLHTTPLNQIVDRADLLAATGTLWALWFYQRDLESPGRLWRPILAAGLFALALLSKENAVSLVFMLILLEAWWRRGAADPWRLGRADWTRSVLRRYLPTALIVAAFLIARGTVLGGIGRGAEHISPLDNIIAHPEYGASASQGTLLPRMGTPLAVFGLAARLLVWPSPLSWDYSYAAIEPVRSAIDARMWLGSLVLCAAVAAMFYSWKRQRVAFACLGIALAAYLVVSNTVFLIGAAFAERYLYLPSAGFCLLIGALLTGAGRSLHAHQPTVRSMIGLAAGVALAVMFAAMSLARHGDFASQQILNAADLVHQPRSARLWTAVAGDSLNANNASAARTQAEKALAIFDQDPSAWRIAGMARYTLGDAPSAARALERAIQLGGGTEAAIATLASIRREAGDFRAAIELLAGYVKNEPNSAAARNNLAWYLLIAQPAELRDPQRALELAKRATELDPRAADFADTYVAALIALGRNDEAKQAARAALTQIPRTDPGRQALIQKLNDLP